MNFWRVAAFAFRERLESLIERRLVRVRLAAPHQDERVEVLRVSDEAVEGRVRDGHDPERRAARRRIEDPLEHEGFARSGREGQGDRGADAKMMVLCVALVDERAVRTKSGEHRRGPLRPIELEHLARRRIDGGDRVRLVERARLTCAHVADRRHAWCLRDRLGRGDRNWREVVLRSDCVVGVLPDLVDRALEARDDPCCQHRHERHEGEADHQSRCRRCGSLRVALGVLAGERACGPADLRRGPAERSRERRHEPDG